MTRIRGNDTILSMTLLRKSVFQGLLRLIGVLLFFWIIARLDLKEIAGRSLEADKNLLGASFVLIFMHYAVKTIRWHLLVRMAGARPDFSASWRVYNVGIFLGNVTPGKLGEFGRIAYLKKNGVHPGTGAALVLLDRIFDIALILVLGIGSVFILFGARLCLLTFVAVGILGAAILLLWKSTKVMRSHLAWLEFLDLWKHPKTFGAVSLLTILGWALYFAWALLLAKSIGIDIPLIPLLAAITITGILSLLPIAPAGLGTRDAALLALLAPYGIVGAESVTLSLLMLVSIIASSLPGLWYWLREKV